MFFGVTYRSRGMRHGGQQITKGSYMLEIRRRDEKEQTVAVCDSCCGEITHAHEGLYWWNELVAEGCGSITAGRIFFSHKRCAEAFRKEFYDPTGRWRHAELQDLLFGWLCGTQWDYGRVLRDVQVAKDMVVARREKKS